MAANYINYPHLLCFTYNLKCHKNSSWQAWCDRNKDYKAKSDQSPNYYHKKGEWEAIYELSNLDDTEGLMLYASAPECYSTQSLDFIQTLKSNFEGINGNIGKTWLVFGEVAQEHEEQSLQKIVSFWNIKSKNKPKLYSFVGNKLANYESNKNEELNKNEQLIVILAPNQTCLRRIPKLYYDLKYLFYYYHKTNYIYQQSRAISNELKNEDFFPLAKDDLIDSPEMVDFSVFDANFDQIKTALKENEIKLYRHTRGVEGLSVQNQTLEINLGNYINHLKEIQIQSVATDTNLEIWFNFAQKTASNYQKQIKKDILSLSPGLRVREQYINTLRGIVEASQAERDRNIENLVGAAGLGVGVSSAAAGAWASNDELEPIQIFGISIVLGLVSSIALYFFLNWYRGNKGKK